MAQTDYYDKNPGTEIKVDKNGDEIEMVEIRPPERYDSMKRNDNSETLMIDHNEIYLQDDSRNVV